MRGIKTILFNRWTTALVGVVLLAALIWFGGPLIGIGDSHPLDDEIARIVAILVVVLIVALVLLASVLRARRTDDRLVESAVGKPAKDEKAEAIDAERLALRDRLTAALTDMRKLRSASGGQYLYELPWYIIIGPPGAGKTTALLNSGLRFPLAERHGAQALKGVGGTRNCDWWFTEQAVIIDTAGRYTTQDSDSAVDKAAWRNFLAMLHETRPSQPLNGTFVVFGIPDVLALGVEERRAHAHAVRARLLELQEGFGLSPPVYVVFTKLDMIAGFSEFFDDLDREDREQVLGVTFPLDRSAGAPQAGFGAAFDRLVARLRTRLLDRLQGERDLVRRNLIFGFPAQFASLRSIVDDLLSEAFDESRFASPLLVRGVYFTSATQQGAPIDRLMGIVASKFGMAPQAMPQQVGSGRGFFLQRLFDNVVFGEAGLVGANAAVERRRRLIRRTAFGAIAAVTLGVCGAWIASYLQNRALVDDVALRVARLEPQIAAAVALPLGNGDVRPILPLLDALRDLPTGFAQQARGEAAAMGLGLYQGERLGVQTAALYRRALQSLLLPRLLVRVQSGLVARLGDPDYAFLALKAYLMLGDPSRLDREFMAAWTANDWTALPEAERTALAAHVDALTAEPWREVTLDAGLIEDARQRVAQLSPAQRALNALTASPAMRAVPAWRVIDNAGPQAGQVLTRRSGRPLTDGVPGLFTLRGYYNVVLPALPLLLRETERDAWVFGDTARQQAQPTTLQQDLLNLYMQAYIQQWEGVIGDLAFTQLTEPRQAAEVLLIISGPNSPFARLFRAIARETKLTQPPGAAATPAAGGSAGGAAPAAGQGVAGVVGRALQLVGGQNPAQIVDDRFRWLHDFVGPDGGPSQMADYLRRVDALGQQAGAAAVGSGGPASGAGVAQLANQIGIEAGRLPEQIAPMVRSLAEGSAQIGASAARQQLAQAWTADVMTFCQRATQGRYPFVRGAAAEIPLDDFGRIFGPGQLIDSFFQNNLRPHIETTQRPWRLTTAALGLSSAAVEQFMRASDIRDAFFPPGSAVPSVSFTMAPLQPGDARQTTLEIDGQILTFDPANMAAMLMQWPRGAGIARLSADGTDVVKIDGAWAFLRMFDRSGPSRRSDDRFEIGMGGVRFQLQARSVRNPFSLRASLDQFRCVPL